jgi:hypothetical protein
VFSLLPINNAAQAISGKQGIMKRSAKGSRTKSVLFTRFSLWKDLNTGSTLVFRPRSERSETGMLMQDIQCFTLRLFVLKVARTLSLATSDRWCFQAAEIGVSIRAERAPSLVIFTPFGTWCLTIMQ